MKSSVVKNVLLLLIGTVLISADKNVSNEFTMKKFEKTWCKISDSLYASAYEVSNLQYREFLYELKKAGKTEEYNIALIDSNGWKSALAYNEPYVEFYFRHPAYSHYPVVNISYEGATMFCNWLTEKYNSFAKRKFNKVNFRLPAKKEWIYAANAGYKGSYYTWGGYYLRDGTGRFRCNFRRIGNENITTDTITGKYVIIESWRENFSGYTAGITSPVSCYSPNSYGMYNVCGNVAEMIKEQGICMGGGWKSPGFDVRVTSEATYEKSADWIGFRYFIDIVEE